MKTKLITISAKEQEILWIVCKLPKKYIKIKRKELLKDYSSHLTNPAYNVFLFMIGILKKEELCTQGQACLESYKSRKEYRAF